MTTIAHDQHVSAFLRVLITELNNREALDATALIHRDDFGGNWQGLTVFDAVESVARDAVDAGHPDQPLDVLAVNKHLLEAGELTNEAFRAYWNELAVPAEFQAPGKWQLKELARRVSESHFRARHAEIYGRDDSHVRPLDEITAEMDNHRKELLAIYNRINPARSLSIVRAEKGGAA